MPFSEVLIAAFAVSALISGSAVYFVRRFALYFNFIDIPSDERKIHKKPTALLGGWAVFRVYRCYLAKFQY